MTHTPKSMTTSCKPARKRSSATTHAYTTRHPKHTPAHNRTLKVHCACINQGWPSTTAMRKPSRSAANTTVDRQTPWTRASTKPLAQLSHKQRFSLQLYCCLHQCAGQSPLQIMLGLAATTNNVTLHPSCDPRARSPSHQHAAWLQVTHHTQSNCCQQCCDLTVLCAAVQQIAASCAQRNQPNQSCTQLLRVATHPPHATTVCSLGCYQ